MSKAEQIRTRLAALLPAVTFSPPESVPVYLHVMEWIGFSQHYNQAANVLGDSGGLALSDLPRILLAGHALECALKACLLAKGENAPFSHDLVELVDRVTASGFRLNEPELVSIVHLNSVFSKDLVSLTRYRARYPSHKFEANVRDNSPQFLVSRIVESLITQASSVNNQLNRHAWSGVDPDA